MMKDKHKKHLHDDAAHAAGHVPAAPATGGQEPAAPGALPEAAAQANPLQAEADALKDRLLRLQADFDNYRKRVAREKEEWNRAAVESVIHEILPVLDTTRLALDAAKPEDAGNPFLNGFRMVTEQLEGVLARFGMKPIHAAGKPFDPQIHEAIAHLPDPEVPESHVLRQTRRGYMIGERLLRPSQVIVSSGQARPADRTDTETPAG
jgi:molecular chaperone GrpE